MKKIALILMLATLPVHCMSQEKVHNKFGTGLINVISQDSSWSMKLGLRIQSLYVGAWNVNDTAGFGVGTSNFMIRRARLKFNGFAFSPKLQYKIELGLSNKDLGKVDSRNNFAPRMILDAVVKWNFYKNFTLWAGQTKLAGNRERVISSANLQFVDRSNLNSYFNIDRDMGFQLRHHMTLGKSFLIRKIVSVSQGEGRNLVQDNFGGYQYTGRVEFLPMGKFAGKGDYTGGDLKREKQPKLSIGVTYDYNDRAVKTRSNMGTYMSYDLDDDGTIDGYFHSDITTIFADLMFKYRGFSLMAEYSFRNADKVDHEIENDDLSITTRSVQVGSGINAQMGYLFKNNWEIAGRFTQIVPTGSDQYEQYTLGLSKYVVGHKLKVQTDVSYLRTNHDPDSQLMYRLQFELHF
jgi:hypothetical protein